MGSKAPDPPDYSQMAKASEESARIMAGLGREQLDFNRQQYAETMPFMRDIATTQRDAMRQQMAQAQDYYRYQQDTFRPLEQQMVNEARSYNTDAKREQLAQQAAADAGRAFATTQQASQRNMASMGVNPNSGRYAGANAANNLGLAAGKASAMSQTRDKAEMLGQAKMMDAIGMGRGLAGASSGAYAGAMNAGNSAGNNLQQPGAVYMQGLGQAANTYNQGFNTQMQGLGQIMQTQGSIYSNYSDPWMTLAGAGLGMASTYKGWTSSKDLKTDKRPVDAEGLSRSVAKLPVDEWRYKPGVEDEDRHIGPYAEDMAKLGAATPDGRGIDPISANGLTLAATKGLSQRLDRIEKLMDRPTRKPSRRTARA